MTYDTLGEQLGVHPQTIGSLARGEIDLTLKWMRRFADVFGVRATEIIEKQISDGLRSVPITGRLQAGTWANHHGFDQSEQRFVTIPDLQEFSKLQLYAKVIDGESMNKVYPNGSIVVFSRASQRPDEFRAGKRYHVIRQRGDLFEETVKTLVRDSKGDYWLQPESDSPEFSAFRLENADDTTVQISGRVRYAQTPEF